MTRIGRVARVAVGLALAGAAVGAVCGFLTLAPMAIQRVLRPTPDDVFVSVWDLAPWAVGSGAVLGAVLGPILAFSLLRPIPLWRAVLQPAVGTVVGSLIGWVVAFRQSTPGLAPIFIGGIGGMLIAGLLLRVRIGRHRQRAGQ